MIEVKNQYPEERDTLNPYNKFLFGDRLDKLQVTINYQTILVACFILAIPNFTLFRGGRVRTQFNLPSLPRVVSRAPKMAISTVQGRICTLPSSAT